MIVQDFLKVSTIFTPAAIRATAPAGAPPTYRSLLGEAAWLRLDPAIRARFDDRRPRRAFYGLMGTVRLSAAGRVLALLARLVGTPLCPCVGDDLVAMIDVGPTGTWRRRYLLPGGRTATVSSVKRFDRRHGLLECLGGGIVMELDLAAERDALHFVSRGYAWTAGPLYIPLPRLLWPGTTRVGHRELGGGRFRFTLAIDHPWLGRLAFQEGEFFEREERP